MNKALALAIAATHGATCAQFGRILPRLTDEAQRNFVEETERWHFERSLHWASIAKEYHDPVHP